MSTFRAALTPRRTTRVFGRNRGHRANDDSGGSCHARMKQGRPSQRATMSQGLLAIGAQRPGQLTTRARPRLLECAGVGNVFERTKAAGRLRRLGSAKVYSPYGDDPVPSVQTCLRLSATGIVQNRLTSRRSAPVRLEGASQAWLNWMFSDVCRDGAVVRIQASSRNPGGPARLLRSAALQ